MTGLLIFGLLVAVLGTSLAKKHEEFNMHIKENGAEFEQGVDLDEEEHIVTVYVPTHNDVDETYFITDTRKHLTMKVAPQKKMCFLMENDPEELPPVDVWRKTKEFTQNKIIQDEGSSLVESRSYLISGSLSASEREDLPSKMKEMCNHLPIVWTEVMKTLDDAEIMPKMTTYIKEMEEWETKRFKRHNECCPSDQQAQKCVVTYENCYRILNCGSVQQIGSAVATCDKVSHLRGNVKCCKPCCKTYVPANNPTRSCDSYSTMQDICDIEILQDP